MLMKKYIWRKAHYQLWESAETRVHYNDEAVKSTAKCV